MAPEIMVNAILKLFLRYAEPVFLDDNVIVDIAIISHHKSYYSSLLNFDTSCMFYLLKCLIVFIKETICLFLKCF